MSLKYVQSPTFYLAGSGTIIGATSVVLTNLVDIYGNVLTMTDFGAKGYASAEPDSSNEEAFVFTGVVANANGTYTLTGVSTALARSPYTETSGLIRGHSGGTKVVITDNVAYWNTFGNKNNDEVITGQWSKTSAPVANNDIPNKAYVDGVAVAGASNANTTTKGIVQEATQAQVDARTVAGSTGADLYAPLDKIRSSLVSDYIVDTGSANAYAIAPVPAITAYAAGQIFSFKVNVTNTTTSTLAVSGLATKTIKKGDGTIVLVPGDLVAGQIAVVEYDGTNFQLISPVNVTPSGAIQMFAGAAAPAGWLLCDGTSYLQATYPTLFAVLSTTYGSADGSHFNVPDMRGRVAVGVGTGTGGGAAGTGLPTGGTALTAVARAGWKGEETHQLSIAEMPAHNHTGTYGASISVGSSYTNYTQNSSTTTGSVPSQGGDGSHNNIQPVMGLNFIIKI